MSISAVISNYNGAAFLAQAIESVLGQTQAPVELLIADDGSTDGSEQIAKRYGQAQWLGGAHAGQAATLNRALRRCKGAWVAFLESDDVWTAHKLERLAELIQEHPQWIAVQHEMLQVDERLNPLPTARSEAVRQWTLHDFLEGTTLLTGMSALAVRCDILARLLPLPGDLITCVDEYLQPRVLSEGFVGHVPELLGKRRVHGMNFYAGAAKDPARLKTYLDLRKALDRHLADFLKERHVELKPQKQKADELQRLQREFLLARYNLRFGAAASAYGRILKVCGFRGYTLFKGATLALAFVSPIVYQRALSVYERQRWLPALRDRYFK